MNFAPTYNVTIQGEGVTRAQVMQAMQQTHAATVKSVLDMRRRGQF